MKELLISLENAVKSRSLTEDDILSIANPLEDLSVRFGVDGKPLMALVEGLIILSNEARKIRKD